MLTHKSQCKFNSYTELTCRAGNFQPGPPGSTQPALKNAGRAKEIGTRLYWVESGYWPAYIGLSRASPSGWRASPLTFFWKKIICLLLGNENYLLFLLELIFLLSFFHVFFLFIFNFNVFRLFLCVWGFKFLFWSV